MGTGQSRKGETTMATDDAGKEPGGGFSPFNPDESGAHGLENKPPQHPRSTSPPFAPSPYAPLVVPAILAAIFNVIVPGTMNGAPPNSGTMIAGFFIGGVVAGQLGLLAAWTALGPWRLYRQWFAASLVELGLFLALVFGMIVTSRHESWPEGNQLLQMFLAVFAVLAGAQVPLWLIRLFRGWRLVLRGSDAARTAIESRQLQIRDIFIAMTVLALFLGTASAVAKSRGVARVDPYYLMEVLVAVGVTAVWSGLVLPICLWVCFGASATETRIVGLVGYLVGLAVVFVALVAAISGARGEISEIGGCFLVLHVGLLATVLSGLGLARACGYVLVSVRSTRRRQAPPDGGQPAAGL
jgi:hypothetical protein